MPTKVAMKSTTVPKKGAKLKTKTDTQEEDQARFDKILDLCLDFLSSAMVSGGDIFDLLDPLISDTQCHIHSLLILNVLHKCYDVNKSTNNGIGDLDKKDKNILSYAVLFSLLKIEYRDKFGFTIYEQSIRNFDSSILSSRNREKYYVNEAKKIFNSYSIGYIRSVASKKTREILNECESKAQNLQFQFLPCYASFDTIIDFIKKRKLPIIVSSRSINAKVTGDDTMLYTIGSKHLRFYEFREDENKFFYKQYPTEVEKKVPTIVYRCYSITDNGGQEFPPDHDIVYLLMLSTTGHVQLPKSATFPPGYQDGEEYARSLYKKNSDISNGYDEHYKLAKEYNLIDSRYAQVIQTSIEQPGDEISITVERRKEDVVFAVDHINVSNYARESELLESLDVTGKAERREVLNFNIEKLASENSKRFRI